MMNADLPIGARTGRRFKGAIAEHLGLAILSGQYAPGTVLMSEVDFAASLDVSRTAFREAIQALTAKGLVESRPRAGTRVASRSQWNLLDPEVLGWAFVGEPDPKFVRGLFELRLIVEPGAAAFAAMRRRPEDIVAMEDALERMARHTLGTTEGREADRDFHDAILAATDNDSLVAMSASVGAAVAWTTKFKQRERLLVRDPIPEHRDVFDAIVARDAERARRAMCIVVERAFDDTRVSMRSAEDGIPNLA